MGNLNLIIVERSEKWYSFYNLWKNFGIDNEEIEWHKLDISYNDIIDNVVIKFCGNNINSEVFGEGYGITNAEKISDEFIKKLPEEILNSNGEKVIAGHWGESEKNEYQEKVNKFNKSNNRRPRDYFLSYFGSQLQSYKGDPNCAFSQEVIEEVLEIAEIDATKKNFSTITHYYKEQKRALKELDESEISEELKEKRNRFIKKVGELERLYSEVSSLLKDDSSNAEQ